VKIGEFRVAAMKELKKYGDGVSFQINEEIRNWQLGIVRKVVKLLQK